MMKRFLFYTLALLCASFNLSARVFDMKLLGADTTGKIACTELINKSIEQAAAEGGGTIYFPAGTYLTASIQMKSNITLHLESGSLLRFSDVFEDYLPFVKMRWEGVVMNSLSPLIYANILPTGDPSV